MKLTMWRVVVVLNVYTKFRENSLLHLSFKETIFPETCLRMKDNNNSPHGKFDPVSLGYLCFNQMATIL